MDRDPTVVRPGWRHLAGLFGGVFILVALFTGELGGLGAAVIFLYAAFTGTSLVDRPAHSSTVTRIPRDEEFGSDPPGGNA